MLVKVRVQTAVHDVSSSASDVFVPPMSPHDPTVADERIPSFSIGAAICSTYSRSRISTLNDPGVKLEIGIPADFASIAPIMDAPLGEPPPKSRREPIVLTWV